MKTPPFIHHRCTLIALVICLGSISQAQGQVNYANAVASLGMYYPNQNMFYVQDSDNSGAIKALSITGTYTPSAARPLAGCWITGGTFAGVGIFDRNTATYYLKNSTSSSGSADNVFKFNPTASTASAIPVAGDWTHKGYDSIGYFVPPTTGTAVFYLKNTNTAGSTADLVLPVLTGSGTLPPTDAQPVVGDWVGDGICRVGFYSPSQGLYYLRMTNNPGSPDCATGDSNGSYGFGGPGQTCLGVMGKWLTTSTTPTQALVYLDTSAGNWIVPDNYLVGKWTLDIPPGYGDFSYDYYPQGIDLEMPPIPVIGKWQPSQALAAGQNTSPTTTPSWFEDAIIYEMRVETFTNPSTSGTYAPYTLAAATAQLPYLASLGINCIGLNPIEATASGPINPPGLGCAFYVYEPDQLDPQIGSGSDFTKFVDTAHSYGIYVILDLVSFGLGTSCPYLSGSIPPSGPWPTTPISLNSSGVELLSGSGSSTYHLDWTNPALRNFYTNFMGKWASTYHFDGVRVDSEPWCGSYPLLSQLKSAIGTTYLGNAPVIIAEHPFFGVSGTNVRRAYTYESAEFDYLIDQNNGLLLPYIGGTTDATNSMTALVKSLPESYYTVGLDSHDEAAYTANGKLSRFSWGLLLSPFIPRWFMGEEFNASINEYYPGALYFNQLNLAQSGSNAAFLNQVKQLIQIRKEYQYIIAPGTRPGFGSLANSVNIADASAPGTDLIPYTMWQGGDSITVLASDHTTVTPTLKVPISTIGVGSNPFFLGTNLLTGTSLMYTNAQVSQGLSFPLAPGSVVPLLLEAQSTVMQDLFTKTGSINNQAPTTGTNEWSLWVSSTSQSIVETGTSAQINAPPVSGGQTIADYPFVLQANTLYTLQATVNFSGPNTSATTGFFGSGFANTRSSGEGPITRRLISICGSKPPLPAIRGLPL